MKTKTQIKAEPHCPRLAVTAGEGRAARRYCGAEFRGLRRRKVGRASAEGRLVMVVAVAAAARGAWPDPVAWPDPTATATPTPARDARLPTAWTDQGEPRTDQGEPRIEDRGPGCLATAHAGDTGGSAPLMARGRPRKDGEHSPRVAFAEKPCSDPVRPTPSGMLLDKPNPARMVTFATHVGGLEAVWVYAQVDCAA